METLTLSLHQLNRKDIVSIGDDLLLTHDVRLWPLFMRPTRIGGYAIIVCMAGQMRVAINGEPQTIGPDTLAVNFPENVLQVLSHEGVDAYAVMISPRFFDDLGIDLTQLSRMHSDFRSRVVFPLPHSELLTMHHYFALLRHNASRACADRDAIVRGLLHTGILQLFGIIKANADIRLESMQTVPERSAQIFSDFLSCLSESCRRERTVRYYADRLCLTARHLSAVVKAYSGRSVSEWVGDYVIIEAKRLLSQLQLDVQEVAAQLNFPSQSTFGKYFKKATGMGPLQFRKSIRTR